MHYLHEDAAQPEHEHRAELRIPGHAQDDLPALRHHTLEIDALQKGLGSFARDAEHHQFEGIGDLLLGVEVELDSTHVGLVDDIRGDDLHGQGVTKLGGGFDSLGHGTHQPALRHHEVVGLQYVLGPDFAQVRLADNDLVGDDAVHPAPVDREAGDHPARLQAPRGVLEHRLEGGYRSFRRRIVGQVRSRKFLAAGMAVSAA